MITGARRTRAPRRHGPCMPRCAVHTLSIIQYPRTRYVVCFDYVSTTADAGAGWGTFIPHSWTLARTRRQRSINVRGRDGRARPAPRLLRKYRCAPLWRCDDAASNQSRRLPALTRCPPRSGCGPYAPIVHARLARSSRRAPPLSRLVHVGQLMKARVPIGEHAPHRAAQLDPPCHQPQ